jgi:hypothetical protein
VGTACWPAALAIANGEIENCSGRAAMFHAPNTVVSLGMSEHPLISPVLQGMGAGFKTLRSGS